MAHQTSDRTVPPRVGVGGAPDPRAAIGQMLGGTDKETRLDLHPEFVRLASETSDLCGLTYCAGLLMKDLLESYDSRGAPPNYTALLLIDDQIRAFRWIVGAMERSARTADAAVEELEDIASSQNLRVRLDANEARP